MVEKGKNYQLQMTKMRFYSHIIDHFYHVFAVFCVFLLIPHLWYFDYLYLGTPTFLI